MGIFPSTPPSMDTATVRMIASFDIEPQGKNVIESTSLSLHEAMYVTIQTCSDDHTNEIHLVASDPYHLIGVGMLKDSSLMGIFPSTPPNTDMEIVNMIFLILVMIPKEKNLLIQPH